MKATISERDPNVLVVRCDVNDKPAQTFKTLLIADVHFDSPHCDREMLKRHLDEAVAAGAGVFVVGDWFDVMQGKSDRRHMKGDVRPELNANNYMDRVVDESIAFLAPYTDSIIGIGEGNHETAITKHLETDVINRLCSALDVNRMGYSGFISYKFQRSAAGKTGGRATRSLFFHHGSGGGGPVTKGVIQTNRRAVYVPDASVVVSGHIHESWQLELRRIRLMGNDRTEQDTQLHVCLPTYKDEYELGGGWHVERGAAPKPMGGVWLDMAYRNTRKVAVEISATRAQ